MFKPLPQIAADEFRTGNRIDVQFRDGSPSLHYVVTFVGGIFYAVNVGTGEALTRPQLVSRYARLETAEYSIDRHWTRPQQ